MNRLSRKPQISSLILNLSVLPATLAQNAAPHHSPGLRLASLSLCPPRSRPSSMQPEPGLWPGSSVHPILCPSALPGSLTTCLRQPPHHTRLWPRWQLTGVAPRAPEPGLGKVCPPEENRCCPHVPPVTPLCRCTPTRVHAGLT